MRRFDVTITASSDELMRHADDALRELAEVASRAAQRLHVMGLDLELRVEVTERAPMEAKR